MLARFDNVLQKGDNEIIIVPIHRGVQLTSEWSQCHRHHRHKYHGDLGGTLACGLQKMP